MKLYMSLFSLNYKKTKQFLWLFFILFLTNAILLCEQSYSQTLLKGGIQAVIKSGEELEIKINTPINFFYSQAGDKVIGYLSRDILIGDRFYIPKGSKVEGFITNIKKPKRFGIDGSFEIDFNQIVTPENISIPIYASITTDRKEDLEKLAEILTYDSALIAYGVVHGAIAGIQYGGIPLAITSHGISVLGGASLGATLGLIGSVRRKGELPYVLTGVNTPVTLKSDFYVFSELPEATKLKAQSSKLKTQEYLGFRFFPLVKKEEVEINITKITKEHSKKYGNYILLNFNLKNNSNKKISLTDLVLVNESTDENLHPDIFLSSNEALKTVKPMDEVSTSLAFLADSKKENYYLAIIDPLDNVEIVKVPLKGVRE